MAPMTAGPAPVRKRLDSSVGTNLVEPWTADEYEEEGRGKGDERSEQAAADTCGRIADDRHGLHHRTWGDLAPCNGVEELGTSHPVIRRHGIVLHERNDDEPATVGQGTDLERHPGQRSKNADRPDVEYRCRDDRPESTRGGGSPLTADRYLGHPAEHEDQHEVGTDCCSSNPSHEGVGDPAGPLNSLRTNALGARRHESP